MSDELNRKGLNKYSSLVKQSAKDLLQNADFQNVKKTWASMGALSKFNAGIAGLNSFVSAYKTGESIKAFLQLSEGAKSTVKTTAGAEIGANVGETIASTGALVMAIPGGQALGLGIAAIGTGIYGISKGVQLFSRNWKGDILSTSKSIGKKKSC